LDPSGGPENVKRVAAGATDFCLTSVHHYLTARAQEGALACRFVAVVVQQSPLAAIVGADSRFRQPTDLAGARVAGQAGAPFLSEFLAALAHLGVAPPEVVSLDGGQAMLALGTGEVDVVVDFVDGMARVRRLAGIAVRAVPVALDVYASGLVAGDHVSPALVGQMRTSVAAALVAHWAAPETGLAELRRRYPEADEGEALEGWRSLVPNIFNGAQPGWMSSERWEQTISLLCDARQMPRPDPPSVYRPELADLALQSRVNVGRRPTEKEESKQ